MAHFAIHSVQDMFKVPAADRGAMLAALEAWLRRFDPVASMCNPRNAPAYAVFWWDDGRAPTYTDGIPDDPVAELDHP